MVNLQELECLMVMLYNRPKKFLRKVFIDWQTLVDFAELNEGREMGDEREVYQVLKK